MTKEITTRIIEPPQQVNFLVQNKEFASQLKLLTKANKQAIDMLVEIMTTSEDDKIRILCADKITSLYDSAAKSAANDNLQKMVAQARLGMQGTSKQLVNADEQDKPKRPVIDFSTVREM